jgi:phosphoketolase
VWRQDHNDFSHQDPGFIDHVMNKKAEIIRVYLPPDANTLLSVTDHCLRSRNYINVIVAGKQPAPQWADMGAAIKHCTVGLGIWPSIELGVLLSGMAVRGATALEDSSAGPGGKMPPSTAGKMPMCVNGGKVKWGQ